MRHLSWTLIVLSGWASAQPTTPPFPLDDLIAQLQKLDTKVWDEREKALLAELDLHHKAAEAARAQAVDHEREVAALRRRVEQHRALRDLMNTPGQPRKAPKQPPSPPAEDAPKKPPQPAADSNPAPTVVTWVDVLPIFEQHCVGCHGPSDKSGGLDISSYAAALQGGSSGEVIQKGDPDRSRLWRLVAHLEGPTMPPDQGPIPERERSRIQAWIAAGALENPPKPAPKQPPADTPTPKTNPTPPSPPKSLAPPMPGGLEPAPAKSGPLPSVKALVASPTAPVHARSGDHQVLWQGVDADRPLGTFPFPYRNVEVLQFSRDGEHLLAAGGDPGRRGGAVLYDVRTGSVLRQFEGYRDSVLGAALSPGETRVALGGVEKRVQVFSVATGEKLFEIAGHNDWIVSIEISPDGNVIASADRSGTLLLTEADSGLERHKLEGHQGPIWDLAFDPEATTLVSGGEDGKLHWWNPTTGRSTRRVEAKQGAILALMFGTDGTLASSGTHGPVSLWKKSGDALGRLPDLNEWVYGLAFSSESSTLYAGSWDGRVHGFDVKTRKRIEPSS